MKTSVKILSKSEGLKNYAVGVFTVDWEPGKKYYGGLLINEQPDPDPGYLGKWFTRKREAKAYAQDVLGWLGTPEAKE